MIDGFRFRVGPGPAGLIYRGSPEVWYRRGIIGRPRRRGLIGSPRPRPGLMFRRAEALAKSASRNPLPCPLAPSPAFRFLSSKDRRERGDSNPRRPLLAASLARDNYLAPLSIARPAQLNKKHVLARLVKRRPRDLRLWRALAASAKTAEFAFRPRVSGESHFMAAAGEPEPPRATMSTAPRRASALNY
jgi:hypothetical protein